MFADNYVDEIDDPLEDEGVKGWIKDEKDLNTESDN